MSLVKLIAQFPSDSSLGRWSTASHGPKGRRYREFGFVEVGHIIDKGQQLAGMDEAECRRIARRDDSRLDDAVKTAVGRRERPVHGIGLRPIVAPVLAPFPR